MSNYISRQDQKIWYTLYRSVLNFSCCFSALSSDSEAAFISHLSQHFASFDLDQSQTKKQKKNPKPHIVTFFSHFGSFSHLLKNWWNESNSATRVTWEHSHHSMARSSWNVFHKLFLDSIGLRTSSRLQMLPWFLKCKCSSSHPMHFSAAEMWSSSSSWV